MFTGLVEEEGKIVRVWDVSLGKRIDIKMSLSTNIGDSVLVDGVCLTVENIKDNIATFFLSEETLNRTKFKTHLLPGQYVNLERSMRADAFFGGHIVSGHIDTTGKVKGLIKVGASYKLTITYPRKYNKFLVEKGSIAIDGISLTLNEVKPDWFSVQVIPHTYNITTVKRMKIGYLVNLEFDMIGKYVVKVTEEYLKNARHYKF